MTVMEVARQSSISISMLSKIENGAASPSLKTLQSLASSFNVPLATFFAKAGRKSDASFVRSGQGLLIERRGSRAGHQYQLLGHSISSEFAIEPYLITLTEEAQDLHGLPARRRRVYLSDFGGGQGYGHADKTYILRPGNSLFFDGSAPHGPEELRKLPSQYLSIIAIPRE